jgi:hypothetical protein
MRAMNSLRSERTRLRSTLAPPMLTRKVERFGISSRAGDHEGYRLCLWHKLPIGPHRNAQAKCVLGEASFSAACCRTSARLRSSLLSTTPTHVRGDRRAARTFDDAGHEAETQEPVIVSDEP